MGNKRSNAISEHEARDKARTDQDTSVSCGMVVAVEMRSSLNHDREYETSVR